jgi:protein-tyrosine phosphatase
MYDIHSHLLPGVENWSKSIEESLEMIIAAAGVGIKGIIATPHYTEGMHHETRQYNMYLVSLLNKNI